MVVNFNANPLQSQPGYLYSMNELIKYLKDYKLTDKQMFTLFLLEKDTKLFSLELTLGLLARGEGTHLIILRHDSDVGLETSYIITTTGEMTVSIASTKLRNGVNAVNMAVELTAQAVAG